jgi:D-glycero-beta-D-manno-heptose-7-phosphate kinase
MSQNYSTLLPFLTQMRRASLIVVGDLFLDEYLIGKAERLSREAPVPVLEYQRHLHIPGGGANPAMNAVALGAEVRLVGVVGTDAEAGTLYGLLEQSNIDTSGLVADPSRPTITKTRVVAGGELRFPQQVVRIDRLSRLPLDPSIETALLAAVRRHANSAHALLVSDYRSGLVTAPLIQAVRALPEAANLKFTADTQGELDKYRGFDLVKCNRAEAEAFLNRTLQTDDEYAHAIADLQEQLEIETILITRGGQGLTVGTRGQGTAHIAATNATDVYDITGAGDTVIAIATLALCAGALPVEAAQLANVAAGLVVRRWGNAVSTPDELLKEIERLDYGASF